MSATKKGTFILVVVLFAITLFINPSLAQVCKGDCGGKYHGKRPTKEELKQILADHAEWVATYKPVNTTEVASVPRVGRANLCGAELSRTNLSGANLEGANLNGASLWFANLRAANLMDANLSGADLSSVNLERANLWGTNLSGANLSWANLSWVNLSKAHIGELKLWWGIRSVTNLSGANLSRANLSDAYLRHANLSGANFWDANLSNADLDESNMDSVLFELKPGALSEILSIARAKNLFKMRYINSPHSLVELREAFKKAGLRQQEREITYAIEHTRTLKQILGEGGDGGIVLGCLKFIGFELTSNYGMSPGRPLWIIIVLILFFSVPYEIVLKNTQGRAGIWQVWDRERVLKKDGQKEPLRLCAGEPHKTSWFAFYFSLLSAFHIGWREFNIGNWIVRMQGREYTLRATGWVRTVSGVQSFISVYLLALSILTYFGRPFE